MLNLLSTSLLYATKIHSVDSAHLQLCHSSAGLACTDFLPAMGSLNLHELKAQDLLRPKIPKIRLHSRPLNLLTSMGWRSNVHPSYGVMLNLLGASLRYATKNHSVDSSYLHLCHSSAGIDCTDFSSYGVIECSWIEGPRLIEAQDSQDKIP